MQAYALFLRSRAQNNGFMYYTVTVGGQSLCDMHGGRSVTLTSIQTAVQFVSDAQDYARTIADSLAILEACQRVNNHA
jgi:hypothetical protein